MQTLALEPGQRTEWVQTAPDPKTARVRLYYAGWSSSTGEADWALRPLLASESFPPRLFNTAYYRNAQVDQDIAQALSAIDGATKNVPLLRNNLLLLMSNRDYQTLMSRDGKEKLRQEALAEVKSILKKQGSPPVDDLLFTSFVVQ